MEKVERNKELSNQYLAKYLEDVLLQEIVHSLRAKGLEAFVFNGLSLKCEVEEEKKEYEIDTLVFLPEYKLIINLEVKRGQEKNCWKNLKKASNQLRKHLELFKTTVTLDWIFVKAACLAASKESLHKNSKTKQKKNYKPSDDKPTNDKRTDKKPCDYCSKFIIWKENIISGIFYYNVYYPFSFSLGFMILILY